MATVILVDSTPIYLIKSSLLDLNIHKGAFFYDSLNHNKIVLEVFISELNNKKRLNLDDLNLIESTHSTNLCHCKSALSALFYLLYINNNNYETCICHSQST